MLEQMVTSMGSLDVRVLQLSRFHAPPGSVPTGDPQPVLVYQSYVVVASRDDLRSSESVYSRWRSNAVALLQRPAQGLHPDALLVLSNPPGYVARRIGGPPKVLLTRE